MHALIANARNTFCFGPIFKLAFSDSLKSIIVTALVLVTVQTLPDV